MNKYAVIADIAGQYDALMRLVAKIPQGYKIYLLGDVVDRGSDGDKIIQWAIDNNIPSVMANHEHMMLDYYERTGIYEHGIWLGNGGHATNIRYRKGGRSEDVLQSHLDWIKSLPFSISLPVEMGDFKSLLLTHAPLNYKKEDADIENLQTNFDGYDTLDLSVLWNRMGTRRREFFQVNGHNSHWGLTPYTDDLGPYGYCLDDSRKSLLTCMLFPEQTVIQEDYIQVHCGE